MSHTKEPWSMFDAGSDIHINESGGAGFIGSIHVYDHRAEQCRENARRICIAITEDDARLIVSALNSQPKGGAA